MPLDEKDKAAIAEMIAASLKSASEEQAKALDATVAKALKGLDIDGKLDALKGELGNPDPDEKGGKTPPNSELAKLQAELEKMKRSAEVQAKRAEEAEQARRAEVLATGVREALTQAGADPKRVAIALSHLKAQGRVKLDKDGRPSFAFTRDWGEDLVDATKGASEWLSTEEGKFFVPPSGAQGTGDGAGKPGGDGSKPADAHALVSQALGKLWG